MYLFSIGEIIRMTIWLKPYLIKYMDKKMKVRILGFYVTVWRLYLNTLLLNIIDMCDIISQTSGRLMMKNYFNHLKSITVCMYFVVFSYGCNYVMLRAIQGTQTRSFVQIWNNNILKVCQKFKGVDLFVWNISTICSQESVEHIAIKLLELKSFSIKNNISSVNEIVKILLRMPEFWIFCYENSANNSGNTLIFETRKNVTLTSMHLEYFQNLSIIILKGNFSFDFTCNVSNQQKNIKFLRMCGLRNKIVQKVMSIILEQLSEHKFLNCSFGFRRERFYHDALNYISQKAPRSLWAIEGSISKCFYRLNYKRLVNLITKKYVSQQVFIDLIHKMLYTKGVFTNNLFISYKIIYLQKSLAIDFTLYNIYLHELDLFIVENNIFTTFWNNKQVIVNSKPNRLATLTEKKCFQGDYVKKKKNENIMINCVFLFLGPV